MKKKFDFSAEMSEAESIRSTPKNEYLEEENHLLDINVQELARLNNNVYKLRTEVENLSGSIRECNILRGIDNGFERSLRCSRSLPE